MPITHISDNPFPFAVHKCASCGKLSSIPLDSLSLGGAADNIKDPNIIRLPTCSCGAQEFLNRAFGEAPDVIADHRKKVNALAAYLKERGQVHPELETRLKDETSEPTQTGDLFGPVRLPRGLPAGKGEVRIPTAAPSEVPDPTSGAGVAQLRAAEVLKNPAIQAAIELAKGSTARDQEHTK